MEAFAIVIFTLPLATTRSASREQAVSYLTKYGYMRSAHDNYHTALRHLQRANVLNTTGHLDHDTKTIMRTPRCGVPDHYNERQLRLPLKTAWQKQKLRYYILTYPDKPSHGMVDAVIRKVFRKWEQVFKDNQIPHLTFAKAKHSNNADINITFWNEKEHQLSGTCEYPLGNLTYAHAGTPPDGQVHFNKYFDWSEGNLLERVSYHEFGHLIGLEHNKDKNSIMFERLTPTSTQTTQEVIDQLKKGYEHGYRYSVFNGDGADSSDEYVEHEIPLESNVADKQYPRNVQRKKVTASLEKVGDTWPVRAITNMRLIWKMTQYHVRLTNHSPHMRCAIVLEFPGGVIDHKWGMEYIDGSNDTLVTEDYVKVEPWQTVVGPNYPGLIAIDKIKVVVKSSEEC